MDGAIKVGSICQTICTYDHRLAPSAPACDGDDDDGGDNDDDDDDDDADDDDDDINVDDDCSSETQ